MTKRSIATLLPALLALALLSCVKGYHLTREALAVPSAWPVFRGAYSGVGAKPLGAFGGKFNILWEKSSNDKPAGPLALSHGQLAYSGTRRKIRFYDLSTGEYLGRIKSIGVPQTGLTVFDSLAFFAVAPKKSTLYGVNLLKGKRFWSRSVKDAAAGSIIGENRLFVSSNEGVLKAFDFQGNLLWTFEDSSRFSTGPSYADGKLFQPSDRHGLLVLSADDGSEIRRIQVDGPMVSAVAVWDLAYGVDVLGNVYAIDYDLGSIVWQTKLDGPIWTAPVYVGGRLFVGHSGGGVEALDAATGARLWRVDLNEVIKASPVIAGKYLIVGTMTGKLFAIDADNGTIVDQRQLDGAIATAPVTDGSRVIIATESGTIVCFGETNAQKRPKSNGDDP